MRGLFTKEGNPFRVKDGRLLYTNGADCGAVYKEVDGYFVWWPDENRGFWEAAMLIKIAELLDEMNRDWHNSLMEYFKEN